MASDGSVDSRLHPATQGSLQTFQSRRSHLLLVRGCLAAGLAILAGWTLIAMIDHFTVVSDAIRWSLAALVYPVAIAVAWFGSWQRLRDRSPQSIAVRLQAASPRMRDDLQSAVELSEDHGSNGSSSFQSSLQRRVGQRLATIDVRSLLPLGLLVRWLITASVVAMILSVMVGIPQLQLVRRFARAALPGVGIERASRTQVRILEPSPPSRWVAAGDAVGIVIKLSGEPAGDARVEYRSLVADVIGPPVSMEGSERSPVDLGVRTTAMSERQVGEVDSRFASGEGLYGANIEVASTPVEYRVRAGDAVTLWHRLTPIARPSITRFEKRTTPPPYAELPSQFEAGQRGDLRGLVDSTVQLTAFFDQPVRDAAIRFRGDVSIEMSPVDRDRKVQRATVPIKTPVGFQVTATGIDSGLSNPFSEQYRIVPIPDRQPVISWVDPPRSPALASPVDVISLRARVSDDLPFDEVFQEFQVGVGRTETRPLSVTSAARTIELNWDWDLMSPTGDPDYKVPLTAGDSLKTRLVAIDRKGQRSESATLEFIIADTGFRGDRHDDFKSEYGTLRSTTQWVSETAALGEQLHDAIRTMDLSDTGASADAVSAMKRHLDRWRQNRLHEDFDRLSGQLAFLQTSPSSRQQAKLRESIMRGVHDLHHHLIEMPTAIIATLSDPQTDQESNREQTLEFIQRETEHRVRRSVASAKPLNELIAAYSEMEYMMARFRDLHSLRASLSPIIHDESRSDVRLRRDLVLLDARLRELDAFAAEHRDGNVADADRFMRPWYDLSKYWRNRFTSVANAPRAAALAVPAIAEFSTQLDQHVAHRIVPGRLPDTIAKWERAVRKDLTDASGTLRSAAKLLNVAQRDQEAGDTLPTDRSSRWYGPLLEWHIDAIERIEKIHRLRRNFLVRHAADLNQANLAAANVITGRYRQILPQGDQTGVVNDLPQPPAALNELADAMSVLDAWATIIDSKSELAELAFAEETANEVGRLRIAHPIAIFRYAAAIESGRDRLNAADPVDSDPELANAVTTLDRTRYNQDHQLIRERVTNRLWRDEPHVAASVPLRRNAGLIDESLASLAPLFDRARQTIGRYIRSLSELALHAASQAEQASQMVASNSSQADKDKALHSTDEAARETIEALVDKANQSDLLSESERQLAVDAEIAAELLRDRRKAVQQQPPDGAQDVTDALSELAELLRKTAEHFDERADATDRERTRAALRDAGKSSQQAPDRQARNQEAEALAEEATRSAEERLKQLEEQLADDTVMKEELARIANQATEAARNLLEQTAETEEQIAADLERGDAAYQERKARLSSQLRLAGKAIQSIRQSSLRGGLDAGQPSVDDDAMRSARKADEALRSIAQLALESRDRQSLQSLRDAIALRRGDLKQATEQIRAARQRAAESAGEDRLQNDDRRNAAQNQARKIARQARDRGRQQTQQIHREWGKQIQQAGTRLQANLREQQKLKREIEQLKQQNRSGGESKPQRLSDKQAQLDNRKRAEEILRQSRDVFREAEKRAGERRDQFAKDSIGPFRTVNPLAGLTSELLAEAEESAEAVAEQLQRIEAEANFDQTLRTPAESARRAAERQQTAIDQTREVASLLSRAARHQTRLEKQQISDQLSQAAQASELTDEARRAIDVAVEDDQGSRDAVSTTLRAAQQLRSQAEQLGRWLKDDSTNANTQQPTSESAKPDPAASQKSAQTLDELDRSIAAGKGEGRAVDASPSLARRVDDQQQRMSRQREEMLGRSPTQSPASGSPGSESKSSGNATDEPSRSDSAAAGRTSGAGVSGTDGSVNTSDVVRSGGQNWGQLRDQRGEDLISGPDASVPPEYRAEVDAYFRAIAEQSTGESR